MKRLFITAIILFILSLALTRGTYAIDGYEIIRRQAHAAEVDRLKDSLPGEAGDILGDLSVMDSLDINRGLSRLMSGVADRLGSILRSGIRDAVLIVLTAIFCAVITTTFGDRGADYVVLAGVLAIAAISVTSVNSFIGLGRTTLGELESFSRMLLPTLTGAAATSGALTSAAAKYAATALFINIIITISNNLIMPLIFAYIAVSVAEAATGSAALSGVGDLIKWTARTILIILVIAFVAYISLTAVITGTSDAVAVRAAKVAISTVLPVVGSIIADASETVLVGASVLRNAIGIFGLLSVLAICLIPFFRLGISYLLFKAAGGISNAITDKRIGGLVNAIGSALGLTLAMVGAAAMMLYISIISVIRFSI